MKIVIIIPTYNERESISALIEALELEFKNIKNHVMQILVVDGNSPDGTAEAVRGKIKKYHNIELLIELEKQGLGMAYINGMNYAINNLKADAFIEFDGDFQHDPKYIKRLVTELDNGYDYVIGSRYVAGGEVPKAWGIHRKILSKFGSLFIKYMLNLKTSDNTSGLKLTRISGFVHRLPLNEGQILSSRHAYKVHLLYVMTKLGAKIKEIPIKFLERESGDSKSSFDDIKETLKVVFKIFMTK